MIDLHIKHDPSRKCDICSRNKNISSQILHFPDVSYQYLGDIWEDPKTGDSPFSFRVYRCQWCKASDTKFINRINTK